jgi:hypothetical protein
MLIRSVPERHDPRNSARRCSFDSLMGSSGGVVIQPALGRAADVYSYGTSFVIGAAFQIMAAPFLLASRRQHAPADTATTIAPAPTAETSIAPAPTAETSGAPAPTAETPGASAPDSI